jgi:deoxyribose-phosphate aldolase
VTTTDDGDRGLAAFAAAIDHTVLGPETTLADIHTLLDEASEYGTNVCVPPCYVAAAAEHAPEVTVATVVGFPHGQHATRAKVAEAKQAYEDGADELDVVVNVGRLQAGDHEAVGAELAAVVSATPLPVKLIVETTLLSDDQKRTVGALAEDAGAAFLKTSTGFADGGATVPDVELLAEYLPVKASGGVGSYDEAVAMLDAGAERIGASSGVEIVRGHPEFEE